MPASALLALDTFTPSHLLNPVSTRVYTAVIALSLHLVFQPLLLAAGSVLLPLYPISSGPFQGIWPLLQLGPDHMLSLTFQTLRHAVTGRELYCHVSGDYYAT